MSGGGTYYELLGTRPDATPAQLRRAYETALANASRNGATRLMVELLAAYEVLSDPGRRRLYDATGMSVPRERVPNTYGRAVAWRGWQSAGGHVPVPNPVMPSRRQPFRASRLVALLPCLLVVGLAFAWLTGSSPDEAAGATVPTTLQPGADGLVEVRCIASGGGGYRFRAAPGQTVHCTNAAAPTWSGMPIQPYPHRG